MQSKKQKFIYWLLGFGSGIILSGILMTIIGLRVANSTIKENEHGQKIGQEAIYETRITNLPNGGHEDENFEIQSSGEYTTLVDQKQELTHEEISNDEVKIDKVLEEVEAIEEVEVVEENRELIQEENALLKTKRVFIASDATATSIARQLERQEIIEDANDFVTYIRKAGKLNVLRSGHFVFPEKATYEEALKILLRK
jgi:hypothetical protein